MLTGKQVRVRQARERVTPYYLDLNDQRWHETAEELLAIFRSQGQSTRGEIEDEVRESLGHLPNPLVHQGLAKLLEDRCEFEVVSGHPPEQLRAAVFQAAALSRKNVAAQTHGLPPVSLDRDAVVHEVAESLKLEPATVEQGLFADLKSEQRLIRFKDTTAERLLQRYNVALAQAVLLRSTRVEVLVRNEPPQRYRQLFRLVKFHRLVCAVEAAGANAYRLRLDGPLSLFSATQKYGLQLALFLPAVLLCRDYEVRAELLWGPERKPKTFLLTTKDGLISHHADTGTYVPAELTMFVELFRKKIADWDISAETEVQPMGNSFWVPDYRLVHRPSGREVLLEVLGFWRRASVEAHLERLREHVTQPFLLAVSDQLHVDDADLETLPAAIHRFRQMPLPDEIAQLAEELLSASGE